ncbi:MAG: hypothetical protein JWO67_1117 [Streptosporangiaceae bacterium]|nr:hypothetical protein [Streptosporangiaceae bacterium]
MTFRISVSAARVVAEQALSDLAESGPLSEDGPTTGSPYFHVGSLAMALGLLMDATTPDGDLAAAEASPANPHGPVRGPRIIPVRPRYPYGRTKHGRFDAGSAAEVAEGAEPEDVPPLSRPWRLELHICGVRFEFSPPPNCPDAAAHLESSAAPFPHLPHLAEHQGGRPDCIICGIDHDAAARLAPPAGLGHRRYFRADVEALLKGNDDHA